LFSGYGLTETGFNSGNTKQYYKKGSSGVIPKGVILKVNRKSTGDRDKTEHLFFEILPANYWIGIFIDTVMILHFNMIFKYIPLFL
jgi:hypothetical protein